MKSSNGKKPGTKYPNNLNKPKPDISAGTNMPAPPQGKPSPNKTKDDYINN